MIVLIVFILIVASISKTINGRHTIKVPYLFAKKRSSPVKWTCGGAATVSDVLGFSDGMAMWFTNQRHYRGGTLFGGAEDFTGIGLIFDTYDNNINGDNPAIILIQNDGNKVQWDVDNDLLADQLERCVSYYRNPTYDKATARIVYQNGIMTVEIDSVGKGSFQECFSHDVKQYMPASNTLYLGLTAATGEVVDNHDVMSMDVFSISESEDMFPDREKSGAAEVEMARRPWYDPKKGLNIEDRQDNLPKVVKVEDLLSEEEFEFTQMEKEKTDKLISLKKQLKSAKENAAGDARLVILVESMDEVIDALSHTSTKLDMSSLVKRVHQISDAQTETAQAQMDVVEEVRSEMAQLSESLSQQTNRLSSDLRRLSRVISGLGGSVNQVKIKHTDLEAQFVDRTDFIHERVERSHNWGFWMWLVVLQVLLFVGLLVWRRYAGGADSKTKRML